MPHIEVESIYIGKDTILVPTSRAIPPFYSKKADGYIFKITMRLKFPDDTMFLDELFKVICNLSNGSYKELFISHANVVRFSSQEYEYSFPIKLQYDDWVEIFLTQRNDSDRNQDVRYDKNTSNKIKIFLAHNF